MAEQATGFVRLLKDSMGYSTLHPSIMD